MMKNKKAIGVCVINIIWAITIFVLCVIPSDKIPNPNINIPYLDKWVHFGMFFIMALITCKALEYLTPFRLGKIYLITMLIVMIYGGAIELIQEYYFTRSGEWLDFAADAIGGLVGCLCYPLMKKGISYITGKL
ncbi:MAG: VanZ family protein [Odoribacter sp.]|nr:VanZ family protein [Odoribacter sp.]